MQSERRDTLAAAAATARCARILNWRYRPFCGQWPFYALMQAPRSTQQCLIRVASTDRLQIRPGGGSTTDR